MSSLGSILFLSPSTLQFMKLFYGGLSPLWIVNLLFPLIMLTVLGVFKVYQTLITEDQAETEA